MPQGSLCEVWEWRHFPKSAFRQAGCPDLWGSGPMPAIWLEMLYALERLHRAWGKKLRVVESSYKDGKLAVALACPLQHYMDMQDTVESVGFRHFAGSWSDSGENVMRVWALEGENVLKEKEMHNENA